MSWSFKREQAQRSQRGRVTICGPRFGRPLGNSATGRGGGEGEGFWQGKGQGPQAGGDLKMGLGGIDRGLLFLQGLSVHGSCTDPRVVS